MSNAPIPASARAGTSLVATLSYIVGLACFWAAWLGSYANLSSGSLVQKLGLPATDPLSDGTVFTLCLVGFSILAFARAQVIRAGATSTHVFTVLVCGILGLGIWALALFEPSAVFPEPLSSGMQFAAFVIGWFGIAGATNATFVMSGQTTKE